MLSVKSASENLRRNRHFHSVEFLDAASPLLCHEQRAPDLVCGYRCADFVLATVSFTE